MIKQLCFLSSIGLLMITCDQPSQTNDVALHWDVPIVDEDILVDRLAPYLVSEQEDTNNLNTLIEHIYDRGWDMEYNAPGIFGAILSKGTGQHPKWGDRVKVHYNGYKLDGSLFDSTFKKDRPFQFYIGNVIQGWNAALPLMDVGARGVFIIPCNLAYGAEGFGNLVGPNQHLLFEIELLTIDQSKD